MQGYSTAPSRNSTSNATAPQARPVSPAQATKPPARPSGDCPVKPAKV